MKLRNLTRLPHSGFVVFVLFFLVSIGLVPERVQADEPEPSATPHVLYEEVRSPTMSPTTPPTTTPTPAAVPSTTTATRESISPSPSPDAPASADAPNDGPSYADLKQTDTQGDITLRVTLPNSIQAGNYITYTLTYENVTQGDISGPVRIEVLWGRFSTEKSTDPEVWQYCDGETTCDIVAESVQGNAVERRGSVRMEGSIGKAIFQLEGDVKAGEGGQFQVRVRSNPLTYPKTNQPVVAPYGSGLLYVGGSGSEMSKDTNTTTVQGPVFHLSKAPVTEGSIYPLDTATFKIVLGNATGSLDKNNEEVIRADAIAATNIEVVDTFPADGEFVEATGDYRVDAENKQVIWNVPGPLRPGETTEIEVTYRKLDNPDYCSTFVNAAQSYSATSDEMPHQEDGEPYRVSMPAEAASVPVAAPMNLSITPDKQTIYYGDATMINVVVENPHHADVASGTLEYVLPANVSYNPDCSECPAPISAPDGSSPGGTVVWDMSGIKAGETRTFSLKVNGTYASTSQNGTASVTAIEGVPGECISSVTGGTVTLQPRLYLSKVATDDSLEPEGGAYIVDRHSEFGYTIKVENRGSNDAVGVIVNDLLPGEAAENACFTYVEDSNGGSPAPDFVPIDDECGKLMWENLTVPANSTLELTYRLKVDGHFYTLVSQGGYCNEASAARGDENVGVDSGTSTQVCVAMEPPIVVTKTSNKTGEDTVYPGDEVVFTLSIGNLHEQNSYTVGLYDVVGEFLPEEASGTWQQDGNNVMWEMAELGPGKIREQTLTVRVPNSCFQEATKTYYNEARFTIQSLQKQKQILFNPPVSLGITVTRPDRCISTPTHTYTPAPPTPTFTPVPPATDTPLPTPLPKILKYSKSVNREEASLYSEIIYTITIENSYNITRAYDVQILDRLPQGFAFSHLHEDTDIPGLEVHVEDSALGEEEISWTIPYIEPQKSVQIIYVARTSRTITNDPSVVRIVAPVDEWESSLLPNGSDVVRVNVRPLIDLVPSLVEGSEECYEPGDMINYEVRLVNNDSLTDYNNTTVVITLPRGLEFVDSSKPLEKPFVEPGKDGYTTVTWYTLSIGKSDGVNPTQKVFQIEAMVRDAQGQLGLDVFANSLDGMIPQKENISPVVLSICAPPPGNLDISKNGSSIVYPGGRATYGIQISNMNQQETQGISLTDILSNRELVVSVEMLGDTPQPTYSADQRRMTWTDLTVPAAQMKQGELQPGLLELEYQVIVTSDEQAVGQTIGNQALVAWPAGTSFLNTEAMEETDVIYPPKNTIRYSLQADREVVGLANKMDVTVTLENVHPDEDAPVMVNMVIPEGFEPVGSMLDDESIIATTKPLDTGEMKVIWDIPTLSPGEHTMVVSLKSCQRVGEQSVRIDSVELPDDTHAYWTAIPKGEAATTVDVQALTDIAPSLSDPPTDCLEQGSTLNYQLDLENRNTMVDYEVTVAVELPIGLRYAGDTGGNPLVSTRANGKTRILWSDVSLARAASDTEPTQKTLSLPFTGGNVWDVLGIRFFVSSDDGAISLREGAEEMVTVQVCPPETLAVGKEGPYMGVTLNSKPVYKITLSNTEPQTASNVLVVDVLPDIFTSFGSPEQLVHMVADDETAYTEATRPEPTIEGSGPYTATWEVDVPGASGDEPGMLVLKYQVSIDASKAKEGETYRNEVTVAWPEGSEPPESRGGSDMPIVGNTQPPLYLPLIHR